jgi:hypothetical protein
MATGLTIDRGSLRQIAAAMALVMMIASLPAVGVIVFSDHSGPKISMDVCHPLQSLCTSTGAVSIARPALPNVGAKIGCLEAPSESLAVAKPRFVETPDPPPPKLLS